MDHLSRSAIEDVESKEAAHSSAVFKAIPGFVHLKTDSPNLYHFTRLVCAMYSVPVLEDMDNVYARQEISEELKIKTYYESLDIAGSNRVHYLKFCLPEQLPPERDEQLKQLLHEA